MVMIGTLKNCARRIFMAKSLKCGNEMGNSRIRRGRRPRRPVIVRCTHIYDQVNMVRHDDIFLNVDIGNLITRFNVTPDDPANAREPDLRGVVVAAPYNASEYTAPIFSANRNEIRTRGAVIIIG